MHACGYLKVRYQFQQKEPSISFSAVMCSMGAEGHWGFDRTVTKKYGCKDFAYDPT